MPFPARANKAKVETTFQKKFILQTVFQNDEASNRQCWESEALYRDRETQTHSMPVSSLRKHRNVSDLIPTWWLQEQTTYPVSVPC